MSKQSEWSVRRVLELRLSVRGTLYKHSQLAPPPHHGAHHHLVPIFEIRALHPRVVVPQRLQKPKFKFENQGLKIKVQIEIEV